VHRAFAVRNQNARAFLAATASGLAAATVASADTVRPPLPAIHWEAPQDCPDAGQVQAAIESMVRASSGRRDVSDLMARATVTQADDGRFVLQMQLDTKSASETQTIDAENCAMLADAFAVVIAFVIDPSVSGDPPAADVPRPAPTARARQESPVERAVSTQRSASGVHGVAGPVLAVGAGLLPSPAAGVGAAMAVKAGLRWELAGMYWPARQSAIAANSPEMVGARTWLASVDPSACLPFGKGEGEFCVGAELGAMHATGTGAIVPDSGTSWWFAPTIAAVGRVRVTRIVDLRFRLDVGVPLFRPSFVVENVVGSAVPVEVYRPAPVFAILRFEPEVQLFSTDRPGARHEDE
jgi:hypothetical protein